LECPVSLHFSPTARPGSFNSNRFHSPRFTPAAHHQGQQCACCDHSSTLDTTHQSIGEKSRTLVVGDFERKCLITGVIFEPRCLYHYNLVMQRFWCVLMLLSVALPQTGARVLLEPPDWNFPQEAKATVAKEMLGSLRVSTVAITLEETRLDKVEQLLGGTTGAKGDAGDSVGWLCFHGTDGRNAWILWLESGEIDGPYIGSFQWQLISSDAEIDRRCHALSGSATIKLALPLKLGMTKAQLLRVLGKPSLRRGQRLIYLHEHQGSSNGVPFDSSNIVMVRFRGGEVTSIAVSKTTSS
jgi:hypothetical protein